MGLFSKPQKQDFPDLPDNLYFAKVAKITEKVGKESGKPYTSWGFELVQPPFQKRWVWGNTPSTVTSKITRSFLTALGLNVETIDNTFNEQTLIGTYIKVLIETKENEDGDKFQNVTKLMPILESEQPLLQQWLAQLAVKGSVRVASQANPTAPLQQPVLAAAPVSLPAAPVTPVAPIVVQQPAAAAPVATKKGDFPF